MSRFLALLVLGFAMPVSAECPSSIVGCNRDAYETADAVHATGCDGGTSIAFDLTAGTFDGAAWMPTVALDRRASAALRDQFTVTGLPPGTPVMLRLRTRVSMESFAGGGPGDFAGLVLKPRAFPAVVGESYPEVTWGSNDGSVVATDSLDLVLPRTAEVPIGIEIFLDVVGQASCYARAHVEFEFVDLPAGAGVSSCHGYLQEPPVPAAPRSWGSVKAAYR